MKKAAIRLMSVQLVTPSHEQTPINTLFLKEISHCSIKTWKHRWLHKSILIISLTWSVSNVLFLNCCIIKMYGLFSSKCFLSALIRHCLHNRTKAAQPSSSGKVTPTKVLVIAEVTVLSGWSDGEIRWTGFLLWLSFCTILWQTGVNKSRHRLIQNLRSMRICLDFSECWIRSPRSMGEEELLHQAVGAGNSANIDLAW